MRQSRKQEHIENYLLSSYKNSNLFEDVYLSHVAVSDQNFNEIDTTTIFLGHKVSFPFMINAVTGGNETANGINEDLSKIASKLNIPMAVGSQKIAIDAPDLSDSFKIVRKVNPNGIIIGNLGALCTPDEAKIAIEMINANALQIHLNLAQELVMTEGDRNFAGILNNIEKIVRSLHVPVIVKEVGTGISEKTAKRLYDIGVRNIDIAGKGGSNFIEIEDLRNPNLDANELYEWGIPTALSLLEVMNLNKKDLNIISSGGIKTSQEIAKSIVMGAKMCAGSGEVINYLLRGGYDTALNYIKNLRHKLAIIMMLLEVKNIEELGKVSYKITGKLKELSEWLISSEFGGFLFFWVYLNWWELC